MNNGDFLSNDNFYGTPLYHVQTFIGLHARRIDYTSSDSRNMTPIHIIHCPKYNMKMADHQLNICIII